MHPNKEDQSLQLVMTLYQEIIKVLKELLGIQYVIQNE